MSGASTPEPSATSRAFTTPEAEKKPIRDVEIPDVLLFSIAKVFEAPFSKYPLPEGERLQIGYRVRNEDGSVGAHGGIPYPGEEDPFSVTVQVPRDDMLKAKNVELWANPYGHTAVLATDSHAKDRSARGRVSLPIKDVPPKGEAATSWCFRIQVLAGVVGFIVDEMNRNKLSLDELMCEKNNKAAAAATAEAERLERASKNASTVLEHIALTNDARRSREAAKAAKDAANDIWAGKVHTRDGLKGAVARMLLGGDGAWDHKPDINPVWGTNNRLGDEEHSFYYDIWSNIHFGYVGHACGFTKEELFEGASKQQWLDSGGPDEQADHDTVEAGFDLYDPARDVTVDELVAVVEGHPEWHMDARRRAWDEAEEAKKAKIEQDMMVAP